MKRKLNGKNPPRHPDMPAQHVRMYEWLMRTPAWQNLDCVARALYLEMARRYRGLKNGSIIFSVREAAEALHVSKATAARAFAKLAHHGFIVAAKRGSYQSHQATRWRLTEFPCDETGEAATLDFAHWHPEQAKQARQATQPDG